MDVPKKPTKNQKRVVDLINRIIIFALLSCVRVSLSLNELRALSGRTSSRFVTGEEAMMINLLLDPT
jgi:hypothetical protein